MIRSHMRPAIAMECPPEGDFTKNIGSPPPQEAIQTISRQALEGLKVMYQNGIAHRDLKACGMIPTTKHVA